MRKFKTKPFKHQLEALRRSQDKEFYALLMEQGTGKSKVVVDTAAHLRREHKIDTVLIIAPKGVAPEWLRKQFPEHMPDDVAYTAALWRPKSGMSQRRKRDLATVLSAEPEYLRIFIMNIEAFGATSEALDFAIEVLDSAESALVVVDESHRIKTPSAHSTKRVSNLRVRAAFRRILTGTVADKPFDLFSQFNFLSPDILQTDSFAAFKSEYAELVPDTSGLMRHIAMRIPKTHGGYYLTEDGEQSQESKNKDGTRRDWIGLYIDDVTGLPMPGERNDDGTPRKKHMVPAYLPTIVAKNEDGSPRYRNLERLHNLIAPHSYRVLKRDCLDLPPKLYNRYYTEMSERQRAIYEQVRDDFRVEWESGAVSVYNRLTAMLRMQQVLCGYIPAREDGEELREIFPSWKDNPRITDTLECIGDRPDGERMIIWCRFVEDIRRITEALAESYGANSVVQFYGAVNDKGRAEAVARFEGERVFMNRDGTVKRKEKVEDAERARFIISQQRAGGVGQTWIAATLSLHYSNTFSLIDRLQAEDRPHRIGQVRPVQYIDIECLDTVDTTIIDSMIAKKNVADVINNDDPNEWLQ